jgi:hypothetical protein
LTILLRLLAAPALFLARRLAVFPIACRRGAFALALLHVAFARAGESGAAQP